MSPTLRLDLEPTRSGSCFLILTDQNGQKWPFGHSGQSEVPENGPNGFLIPKNLGIDTKIKPLACSEPKLEIWPDFLGTNFRIAKKCLNIALIQKIRALYFLQNYLKFIKWPHFLILFHIFRSYSMIVTETKKNWKWKNHKHAVTLKNIKQH